MNEEPSTFADLSECACSTVWISHDRKVMLTLREGEFVVDGCSYFMYVIVCTGVRSRSMYLLDWLKKSIHCHYFKFDLKTLRRRIERH